MRRREIPSSGEMLPVVGLGTWQQFDVGTSESARAPLKEVLRRMVELGGALSTLRRCTAAPSRSLAT